MWIDCDYLLDIMRISANGNSRGGADDETGVLDEAGGRRPIVDQENICNATNEREVKNVNETEAITTKAITKETYPNAYNEKNTVRHIKLKIDEVTSTLRAKQYQNLISEDSDSTQTDRL